MATGQLCVPKALPNYMHTLTNIAIEGLLRLHKRSNLREV